MRSPKGIRAQGPCKTAFRNRRKRLNRKGASIVEFALLAPILILLVLGTIDLGQYINVSQAVSNASREGALVAARSETTSASSVESAVRAYMTGVYPNAAGVMVGDALQITTSSGDGADLSTVNAGSSVSVKVSIEYNAVRWLSGLDFLGGKTVSSTTIMRKE